jgi:hypothetical protein
MMEQRENVGKADDHDVGCWRSWLDFVAAYASSASRIQRNERGNCWCSDAHVLSNLTINLSVQ